MRSAGSRKPRSLGRPLPSITLNAISGKLGGFAGLLRTVAIADCAIAATSRKSSLGVEEKVGWARRSVVDGEVKTIGDGRIRRARKGLILELEVDSINRILKSFQEVSAVICPPLWLLVAGAEPSPSGAWYEDIHATAFWMVHVQFPFLSGRDSAFELFSLTPSHLTRLCLLGSLDAVAVLWFRLLRSDKDEALSIAQHIPPALALIWGTPGGARIATLLFARIRQLVLDRVNSDGWMLDIDDYDLAAARLEVVGWHPGNFGPPSIESRLGRSVSNRDVPTAALSWLEQFKPRLIPTIDRDAPYWTAHCRPSVRLADEGSLAVFEGQGLALIKASLGPYW